MEVRDHRAPTSEHGQGRPWWKIAGSSSLLWGGLLTLGFYSLLPYWPFGQELAQRYFCGHPLEYVSTTLFFIGVATLALKAVRFPVENAVFRKQFLDEAEVRRAASAQEAIQAIERRLPSPSSRAGGTYLVRRIRDAGSYIRGRGSASGLEEHLKYLAELAGERLQESYALVRTISWAVPILGFLGTVIGITMAIANVTPEQLDSSLSEVTGGLAVAFDTTALALALSLLLVFASFLVERAEQNILARVEEFGIKRLASLVPAESPSREPLQQAQQQAAEKLLNQTEALLDQQTRLWQESLEGLRQRWTETLEAQKQDFDASLRQGMAATLEDHQRGLNEAREEFLQGCQGVSEELRTGVDRLIESMNANLASWQESLRHETEAGTARLEELRRQGELLQQIVGDAEQLAGLQKQLTDNLEAVRASQAFEETLHSLNAAVHLLTARTKPNAA